LLDNDNIVKKDFIDKLYEIEKWNPKIIYHPAFAAPNFDYRFFNDEYISRENIHFFMQKDIFMTLLNTNNYLVNRDEYLKIYKYDKTVRGADGIFFAYNWLKSGNLFYIVPDLQYFHRVHPGSEFLRERDSNMQLINFWLNKIKTI
jgi:hypothetical protein